MVKINLIVNDSLKQKATDAVSRLGGFIGGW